MTTDKALFQSPSIQNISGLEGNSIRVTSIDILRALTMVLMLFVNDLGSLKNIPDWLEHVGEHVDGLGLADTVFPAFLFIVGMSIPYAMENRRKKGDSQVELFKHVFIRTVALLVMGVFLVNGETVYKPACGIGHPLWYSLSCLCFIFIWNVYPKTIKPFYPRILKTLGILTLIGMAYIYRGKDDGRIYHFSPQWWGILGLIGWAYLISGISMVLSKGKFSIIFGVWILFCTISILYAAKFISHADYIWIFPNPITNGTHIALTLGGVLCTLIFKHYREQNENLKLTWILALNALVLLGLAFYFRQFFILSKIDATPTWLFLCSGITILAFLIVFWISDQWGKSKFFKIIMPAGTDTLLCYIIPYFLVALMVITHFKLPFFMIHGGIGLIKSLLFALLCVYITFLLNKASIKLKL